MASGKRTAEFDAPLGNTTKYCEIPRTPRVSRHTRQGFKKTFRHGVDNA
jgi:hypothetical protein